MSWDITFDKAMAQAKGHGIDPEHAAMMWEKYNELGAEVRAGTRSDGDALALFAAYCTGLGAVAGLNKVARSKRTRT